jgi:hypothetical protein
MPFDLLLLGGSGFDRLVSVIDCVEFCLPLAVGGLLLDVGMGDVRPASLGSAKVGVGEEASVGDIAFKVVPVLNISVSYGSKSGGCEHTSSSDFH